MLLESDHTSLVVGVPGECARVWLERRLRSTVEQAAAAVLGRSPAISFVAMSG